MAKDDKSKQDEIHIPTPDWRTLPPPPPRDSDIYAEDTYGEKDVTWWDGRHFGGITIGILTFRTNTPFIPGNINNASTFKFPVMYYELELDNVFDVFSLSPTEKMTDSMVDACKYLEMKGARAIIGGCGFMGTYQKVVQARIDIPLFCSSLMMLPMMVHSMPGNKKVGVVTANQPTLEKADAVGACGLHPDDRDRIVIEGAEKGPEFGGAIMSNSGGYNPAKAEADVVNAAKRLVDNHDIGAIFLECSELAPHAHAVQKEVRLPVWDYTSLAEWVYQGCVRRRFYGVM